MTRCMSTAAAHGPFPHRWGAPNGEGRGSGRHGRLRRGGLSRLMGWLHPPTGGLDALLHGYPLMWALMAVAQPPVYA